MTESELALAEQKCNDYSVIINRLKQELSDSSTVHQSDIRREREVSRLKCKAAVKSGLFGTCCCFLDLETFGDMA